MPHTLYIRTSRRNARLREMQGIYSTFVGYRYNYTQYHNTTFSGKCQYKTQDSVLSDELIILFIVQPFSFLDDNLSSYGNKPKSCDFLHIIKFLVFSPNFTWKCDTILNSDSLFLSLWGGMIVVTIPAKVKTRLTAGLKKFQPVLSKAKTKDVNESDTVTIIADMLADIFGYDKYSEITSEYAVKKTYCDLAIEIGGKVCLLVEVKAIGLDLKDDFVRQACDYGANSGIEWVALTNGVHWIIYKIIFSKPVERELIYEFDMTELSAKKQSDIEMLFYLSRESIAKPSNSMLQEFAAQKQIMNHAVIGQLLLTDTVLDAVRKQIKKLAPDARPTNDEIKDILASTVIKRDVFEGDKSQDAKKRIAKYERAVAKQKNQKAKAAEQE